MKTRIALVKIFPNKKLKKNYDYKKSALVVQDYLTSWGKNSQKSQHFIWKSP